jgi:hypothetical protein
MELTQTGNKKTLQQIFFSAVAAYRVSLFGSTFISIRCCS